MQIEAAASNRPPIMIFYGDHKIGKSSFANEFPRVLFSDVENGAEEIEARTGKQVLRFTMAQYKFQDVLKQLEWLRTAKHDFKTWACDTLDELERIMWSDLCAENGWEQIGDGSFGKGYKLAINRWKEFMAAIKRLNSERKMIIALLAHAKLQKFEDPTAANYDRWDLDLHEKSANFLCQNVDLIGFCSLKTLTAEKKQGFRDVVKPKTTGEVVVRLNKAPGYEAGNRYGLPAELPMSWPFFAQAFKDLKANRPKPGNLAEVKAEKEAAEVPKIGLPNGHVEQLQLAESSPNGDETATEAMVESTLQDAPKKRTAKKRVEALKEKIVEATPMEDNVPN